MPVLAGLVLICSALVCGLLAIGFRLLLQRHLADDRAAALTVAGPLMPALGAVFALLAATTLGAEAGSSDRPSDDVSAEAAAASRLAWASTTPGIDSEAIQADLAIYLASDPGHGVGGRPRRVDPRRWPRSSTWSGRCGRRPAGRSWGAPRPVSCSARSTSLTSLRRQRLAHGSNQLPDGYLLVVLMSGLALVANSAALAIAQRGRVALLTAGLVIVVASSLALLVAISSPFTRRVHRRRRTDRCRRAPTSDAGAFQS